LVFDQSVIDELKENGKVYHLENGEKISLDKMYGKKVILICDELIKELCDNVNLLKNYDDIKEYFKLNQEQYPFINESFSEEVKSYFQFSIIKKMVFFHELGHCAFHKINEEKNITDRSTCETQANFFASIALNGEFDLLLEIYNNILIDDYHNPLLKSHEYKIGQKNIKKELDEMFGE